MMKSDIKLFLHKKVNINVKINSSERYYSGYIVKLHNDSILFKDKYGAMILFNIETLMNIEEIPKEKLNDIFGDVK